MKQETKSQISSATKIARELKKQINALMVSENRAIRSGLKTELKKQIQEKYPHWNKSQIQKETDEQFEKAKVSADCLKSAYETMDCVIDSLKKAYKGEVHKINIKYRE